MERVILVRGEGEARALPDRALLSLAVDGDGSSREEAYEEAARLTTEIDAVLAAESEALGRVTTTALMVQPRTRWRKGEAVRTGWQACRTSTVEITALERLGELLARFAAAGAAIAGPSWELDADHEAHGRARHEAAADARRRAQDYAVGLDVQLGPVAWVAEPGLRLGGSEGTSHLRTKSLIAGAGVAEEPIEVAPEEITVRAAVEVGFTLGP